MKNANREPITIAFFKADSVEGHELFASFQQIAERDSLRGYPVKVLEQRDYRMMPAILACINCDVVIFDGSIEDEENNQYRAAIELMKGLDHVLIVSRTFLPFNFEGIRKGGAPRYVNTGTVEYSGFMTNEVILRWLFETLEHSDLELPRPAKAEISEAELRRNFIRGQSIIAQMMKKSLSKSEKQKGAFVSYLSRYSKFYTGKHSEYPYVEDLFDVITQVSEIQKKDILYFPPGNISLELMTEQRRFEISHITEAYITGCKEIWIYDTPDYSLSWWTYGEILALSHVFSHAIEKCPDIYVVKPLRQNGGRWDFQIKSYKTSQEKKQFLPALTSSQENELANIFANSNPETIGYEQVPKMRALAQLPTALLKLQVQLQKPFLLRQMYRILESVSPGENPPEDALSTEAIIENIRSYGYTQKFWENRIIDCPICRLKNNRAMTLEDYLYFKADHFYSLSEVQYRQICEEIQRAGTARVTLPCGHHVVLKKHQYSYYRWWTVKNNVPTGPNGKLIERIDTISVNSDV